MQPVSLHVYGHLSVTLAGVGGEIDADTAPGLAARLRPLARGGRPLLVELAGVSFCGCAGLDLLLELTALADGALVLAAPSTAVRRILALGECEGRIPVAGSVREALDSLGLPAASIAP